MMLVTLDFKCRGGGLPPVLIPPRQRGGGETQPNKNCAKKRCVKNLHGHLRTRLKTDVTSATSPLVIEGVKDGDGQAKLADRLIKIKGGNGGKEKGTAPAAHTTALVHSSCPTVDTCCKFGTMLTCKTAQCEFRKAARVCVSCQCLGRCANVAPQTRQDKTRNTEGATGTGKHKRRQGRAKEELQQTQRTKQTRPGREAMERIEGGR